MRSNYEEKRVNRQERYERLAEKFKDESESRYNRFKSLLSVIPMGQPILIGHHSEGAHRSLLRKSDTNMRLSIEADKKAAYYEGRADTIEKNHAISSDDPNALERLREKLQKLQETQDFMKKVNAAHAKYLKKPQSLELSDLSESAKQSIRNFVPEYSWIKHPYAPYQLSNNTGNMSTIKKRIKKLEAMEGAENIEKEYGDIRIFENATENRVQIFFPGKPEDEVRKKLKSSGFRWAPSVGCWQSYYSNYAKWKAEEIVKGC